jgi:hypothetical protein
VTLNLEQTAVLERMAAAGGRTTDQLVGDAVDRYLRA